MIRVLHVHTGNLFGGVERILQTIAGVDPAESGVTNEFALCFSGELEKRIGARGATVHHLGEVRLSRPWTILPARRRLRQLLREREVDVVLSHSIWIRVVFGSALKKAGARDVVWVHDALDGKHWLQRLAKRSRPEMAICGSRFSGGLVSTVYPGLPVEVLDYPLEYVPSSSPADRERTRAELGVPPGSVVIVQLGRLERYKGHTVLLEALGHLKDVPDWVCWQVGGVQRPQEAVYLKEMKDQVARAGIEDRVLFLGQQINVPRILGAADIYCQPNSGPEPYGLVFIEAMLEGLPVVTSSSGGGAEVVAGSGWLVEPGNVARLAAVLRELIENPEKRSQGADARRRRGTELTDPVRQMRRFRDLVAKEGTS